MLHPLTRANRMPFLALDDLRREIDRAFGWNGDAETTVAAWALPTDVVETSDAIHFSIELPGVHPEDLDLTVENRVLTVSGEKRSQWTDEDQAGGRLFERRYGRIERSFRLPDTADPDEVNASFDNGVLHVTVGKRAESKARRIEIRGASEAARVEAGEQS